MFALVGQIEQSRPVQQADGCFQDEPRGRDSLPAAVSRNRRNTDRGPDFGEPWTPAAGPPTPSPAGFALFLSR